MTLHTCCCFSRIQLCVILWTVARQAPLSMGFSREEYWIGLPFPPPGDLPDLRIESTSPTSPALAGRLFTTSATWEAQSTWYFQAVSHPSTNQAQTCWPSEVRQDWVHSGWYGHRHMTLENSNSNSFKFGNSNSTYFEDTGELQFLTKEHL